MPSKLRLVCALILGLGILFHDPVASGQQPQDWIGKKVVTKYPTKLRVGRRVVDDNRVSRIYTVERIEGNWLWLDADDKSGWVPASEVVPFDQALEFFTQEIRANPGAWWAYLRRGTIWKEKREYDIAIADYNEAIRLNPTDAVAYNDRGNAWHAKMDYARALADYNEAIRLDPRYILAFGNRGFYWYGERAYGKALDDYAEAIRLDPKCSWAYRNRAWIWATCPDTESRNGRKAVEAATRACELNEWRVADDLATLAAAYAEAGDFEQAVRNEERAHRLYTDPEDRKMSRERLKLYREGKPYRDEG